MLPPSMDYEVGKGRMVELERKIAARRLLDEALASRKLEHIQDPVTDAGRTQPHFLARVLAFFTRRREVPPLGLPREIRAEPTEQFRERFVGR